MSDELRALAAGETSPLDEHARARIRARIRAEGPRVVIRAHRVRRATRASAAVGVLGLVAVAAWLARPAQAPLEPGRSCERYADAQPSRSELSGARTQLELPRARWVLAEGTNAQVRELSPCRLAIELEQGRVTVHARALGGGELEVHTPVGSARVRGTIFSVERNGEHFAVRVAEGKVEVQRPARAPVLVGRGQELSERADRAEPSEEVVTLLARDLAPQPPVVEAAAAEPGAEVAAEDTRGQATRAERRPRRLTRRGEPKSSTEPPDLSASEADPPASAAEDGAQAAAPQEEPKPWPKPERGEALGGGGDGRSAEDLVREGDAARRVGDYPAARAAYRRAGQLPGPTAEAAWLALARMELTLGRADAAKGALGERRARFGRGRLDVEAAWITVQTLEAAGDKGGAKQEAERLIAAWPGTPQAAAAQRWLEERRP